MSNRYALGRIFHEHLIPQFVNARKKRGISQLEMDEIDFLIPHQANIRIIQYISKKLNFPKEKIIVCLPSILKRKISSKSSFCTKMTKNQKILIFSEKPSTVL